MIPILYQDNRILVCIKPAGVVSTDEAGGLPSLLRTQLGDEKACVRTVHRLDQVVGGVMVLARSKVAAQILSKQVQDHTFYKEYLAVTEGVPEQAVGTWTDLLWRDKAQKKTLVVTEQGKDVQEAILDYRVEQTVNENSLICIHLRTGRTHQIRCQSAHHGCPLAGDQKYGGSAREGQTGIALWSHKLSFLHPQTGERMTFSVLPPEQQPWTLFKNWSKIEAEKDKIVWKE